MPKRSGTRALIDEAAGVELALNDDRTGALILDSTRELPRSCKLAGNCTSTKHGSAQRYEIEYLRFPVGDGKMSKFFCSPCVLRYSRRLGKVHRINGELGTWERVYGKTYVEVDLQKTVGQWLTTRVKEYAQRKKIDVCWNAYNHEIVYLFGDRAHVEARLPAQNNSEPDIIVSYENEPMTLLQMMCKAGKDVSGVGIFTCRLVEYKSWHAEKKQMVLRVTLAAFRHVSNDEAWLHSGSREDCATVHYDVPAYVEHSSFAQMLIEGMNTLKIDSEHKEQEEEQNEDKVHEMRQLEYFR